MSLHHALFAAGGVAFAGVIAGLAQKGILHKGAVAVTSGALAASDAITTGTQNIIDDANDMRAEARRQAKIDAAVKERLAQLEETIREEETARIDALGAEK